jgi:hypothetical protein
MGCTKIDDKDASRNELIKTTNYSYKTGDQFRLMFDVVNKSDSVVYVMTSNWYLYGNKNRFSSFKGVPTENFEVNSLIYFPVHPWFIQPRTNSFLEIKPEFEYFPTFTRLEPNQFQRIQLIIGKDITNSLKKILNQFSFSASVFYLTAYEWEDARLKRIRYYDTNNNVVAPSSKTISYDIDKELTIIDHSPAITANKRLSTPAGFHMSNSDYIITKFFLR